METHGFGTAWFSLNAIRYCRQKKARLYPCLLVLPLAHINAISIDTPMTFWYLLQIVLSSPLGQTRERVVPLFVETQVPLNLSHRLKPTAAIYSSSLHPHIPILMFLIRALDPKDIVTSAIPSQPSLPTSSTNLDRNWYTTTGIYLINTCPNVPVSLWSINSTAPLSWMFM